MCQLLGCHFRCWTLNGFNRSKLIFSDRNLKCFLFWEFEVYREYSIKREILQQNVLIYKGQSVSAFSVLLFLGLIPFSFRISPQLPAALHLSTLSHSFIFPGLGLTGLGLGASAHFSANHCGQRDEMLLLVRIGSYVHGRKDFSH